MAQGDNSFHAKGVFYGGRGEREEVLRGRDVGVGFSPTPGIESGFFQGEMDGDAHSPQGFSPDDFRIVKGGTPFYVGATHKDEMGLFSKHSEGKIKGVEQKGEGACGGDRELISSCPGD